MQSNNNDHFYFSTLVKTSPQYHFHFSTLVKISTHYHFYFSTLVKTYPHYHFHFSTGPATGRGTISLHPGNISQAVPGIPASSQWYTSYQITSYQDHDQSNMGIKQIMKR